MANRNRNRNPHQQPRGGNPWATLDVSGFGHQSQLDFPPLLPLYLTPIPAHPSGNPWMTLNIDGFSPTPPQMLNTHVDTRMAWGDAAGPPQPPQQPPSYQYGSAVPAEIAVENLRNPHNIEHGALRTDGSVVFTREWVAGLVGNGHIERATSGNLVLARTSEIRRRGLELGLHPGFLQWMTEPNQHAAHGAGGNEIQIKPADADIWFRRTDRSELPSTSESTPEKDTEKDHQ
jgi:hypothetical protein